MDKAQAFEVIEQAKIRLLTEEEAVALGLWAEQAYAANPPTGDNADAMHSGTHELIEWVVKFTKETRPTPHFNANFKRVNAQVMPWAVKCFSAVKS